MNESGETPLVVHVTMFAASLHRESFLESHGVDQTPLTSDHLRHKGQALKLVRQLVADQEMPLILDDLIMAIMYLAMNERAHFIGPLRDLGPFTPSPALRSAQWLNMYTGREANPSHWNAVQIVLRQHGGIQKLTKYGIAWLIS